MITTRSLSCLLLLGVTFACHEEAVGDDLPPGAFTSGPDDGVLDDSTSGPGVTETSATTPSDSGETGVPINPTHEEHIQPIWTASCALDVCHDPVDPQASLDLLTDGVYDRLCTDYHGQSGMPYIDCEGNDPQNSYVFRKIENTHLEGITGASGGPMPPTEPLTDVQIATIETWILEGAQP